MSEIIEFYRGNACNSPYTLEQILNFSDKELEHVHNHIQWLFPTSDPRNKETGKPFLEDEDIKEFKFGKNSEELKRNIAKSYNKMLMFYGLDKDTNGKLHKAKDFDVKSNNWLNKKNHNYLRLTRMISCLNSLGFIEDAENLFEILSELYEEFPRKIGDTTYIFWEKAVNNTLYDEYKKTEIDVEDLKSKLSNLKWSD